MESGSDRERKLELYLLGISAILRAISLDWFRPLPDRRGHLFGRVLPAGLLNYWAPAGKRSRSRTETAKLLAWNFSYFSAPIARWVSGVTRSVWAFTQAGLSRRVYWITGRRGWGGGGGGWGRSRAETEPLLDGDNS